LDTSLGVIWPSLVSHGLLHPETYASNGGLKAKAVQALRRMQKMPGLVRSFFPDPHLRYIAAA
jgi:hypothetical protein